MSYGMTKLFIVVFVGTHLLIFVPGENETRRCWAKRPKIFVTQGICQTFQNINAMRSHEYLNPARRRQIHNCFYETLNTFVVHSIFHLVNQDYIGISKHTL